MTKLRQTARDDEAAVAVAAVHAELVSGSALEPVLLGGEDERAWADCDLASLAENRLGIASNPRNLQVAERDDFQKRALVEPFGLPSERRFEVCYWLLESGNRVGTVALASSIAGGRWLRLSSLYVFPDMRRQGVGARALGRLHAILGKRRLGIRLETCWSWQAAVRFYLRAGYWVHGWKRELTFRCDSSTPPPLLALDGKHASLSIDVDGARVLLARAERAESTLILPDEESRVVDQRLQELYWNAPSTLSLWLALHGWPLIRSAAEWQAHRHSDFGSPEALACKIAIWEAWDVKHGFRVETPRIPGLSYPTWDELEAEWNAPAARRDLTS